MAAQQDPDAARFLGGCVTSSLLTCLEWIPGYLPIVPLSPPPPPLRLVARPALVGAIALGVGIVSAGDLPVWAWLGAVLACAIGLAVHRVATRTKVVTLRPLVAAGAGLLALAALGGARMAAWNALPPDDLAHAVPGAMQLDSLDEETTITLWGRVASPPVAGASGVRFVLRADSALRETPRSGGLAEAPREILRQPVRGQVQVTLAAPRQAPWEREAPPVPIYPTLRLGDRIVVGGPLLRAGGQRNPADFDYRRFLAHRGVHATLRASEAEAVQFLAPAQGLRDRLTVALRQRVQRALGAHVASENARAVLAALLIADRSRIDGETRDAFVRAGLVHLLAVSGLHVLMVGFGLYVLLGPLLGRIGVRRQHAEWGRSAVTFALLLAYVLVTGAAVPVVRAFVMASIALLGRALQKPVDTLNGLGLAAMVLLLRQPTALFEVGFQLSFSAVAAIATLTPLGAMALRRVLSERTLSLGPVKWSTEMTLASLAATLGTAPVLLVHFGRVPLAGLALNLAAIPLTGAALFTGLLTSLATPIPWLADVFGATANLASRALLGVSEFGAGGIGGLAVERFVEGPLAVLALAACLGAMALWLRPRARWRLAVTALGLLVLGAWTDLASGDRQPAVEFVFFDVGQGDATLLSLPGGAHVLVDAGRPGSGTWTVLPHLQRFGIRHLDAVIATHADADHTGGLAEVLRETEVGRLIHSGETREDGPWAEALHVSDSLGIRQRVVQAGDTLDLDLSVRIRVLAPGPEANATGDSNERSVALLVQYGDTDALLTGDAEAASEAEMVARYGSLLRAEIAKVGHHGSRTSSTPAFVQSVTAASPDTTRSRGGASRTPATASPVGGTQWAVVSVARRNRYGLPAAEPLARWKNGGARVVSTAEEGAIWIRTDGRDVNRIHWRR